MGFGFAILRLPPDAFWRLTPRELASAVRMLSPAPPPGLDRAGLAALMARFPDAGGSSALAQPGDRRV